MSEEATTGLRPLKQLLRSDGISKAEHAALVAERKAIAEKGGRPPAVQPTRDVLVQKGYEQIVRLFPKLAKRLEEALDDKNDPLHERAVDILSKRGLPIAFFEGLAKQEFRTDEEQNHRPTIVINVTGGAGATVQPVDVVDVEATER